MLPYLFNLPLLVLRGVKPRLGSHCDSHGLARSWGELTKKLPGAHGKRHFPSMIYSEQEVQIKGGRDEETDLE